VKTGLRFISDSNNHSLVGNPPAGRLHRLIVVQIKIRLIRSSRGGRSVRRTVAPVDQCSNKNPVAASSGRTGSPTNINFIICLPNDQQNDFA
jgi:hypothetical protein